MSDRLNNIFERLADLEKKIGEFDIGDFYNLRTMIRVLDKKDKIEELEKEDIISLWKKTAEEMLPRILELERRLDQVEESHREELGRHIDLIGEHEDQIADLIQNRKV